MEKTSGLLAKDSAQRLHSLLEKGMTYLDNADLEALSLKTSSERWSKKEVLGHLIDSGINNLRRFTEIQFEPKPYQIQDYKQDELVRVNNYQDASIEELTAFWKAVNTRIQRVILRQTDSTLVYPVVLGNGETVDLNFLIRYYVAHLEHHLNQIFDPFFPTDPRSPTPKLFA